MPKHSDRSEDEEEWLEEELSRGKGKNKKSYGSSEDEARNDDYFSSSDSDSDGGRRRGGGRSKAAPPPLKKRKSGGGRRASSPSDSSDDGRDDDLDADSGDGFGDDLMGDDDDRAYLSSLTEMERENILNERYEARKKRVERMELRRKLQQSKGTRASARASTAKGPGAKTGVKASALSNLKAKREEKATRAKRRAKEIEDRVDVEGSSDDDSDQWDRGRKRAKHDARPAATPSAAADKSRAEEERKQERGEKVEVRQYPTLEEINSVKLGRSLLEKWLDQPFFEKTVPRFFVRVGIGMNREQQNAYRMAQIVVAEKGPRTYTVGKKKTQYMLKLSHGGNSKNFSIEYVSNSPITMPEYERWLREVDKAHMDIPTPADIEARRRDLESTRHYVYTHEDISRMIEEKSQLRARPVNLAATKAHLMQLREAAKDRGTAEEVAKVDAELQRFAELDKRETEKRQKKLKVGDINKRNKAKNIVDSHVTAVIEAKAETDDPFSRRPTAPTFHIFASKPAAPAGSSSSSSSSELPPAVANEAKTPVPAEKAAASTPVPNKGKEKEEQEDRATEPTAHLQLHDTLDLDIEVNLDDLASPTTKRPLSLPHANRRSAGGGAEQAAKAKAISLDDYKRRRGLL